MFIDNSVYGSLAIEPASQSMPSYRLSTLVDSQGWMYQFPLRREFRLSLSVNAEGVIAFGKS